MISAPLRRDLGPDFQDYELLENDSLDHPEWGTRGAVYVVFGSHCNTPKEERCICADHSPLFAEDVRVLKHHLRRFGFEATSVRYRLVEEFDFEPTSELPQPLTDHARAVMDLIRLHHPLLPSRPPQPNYWPRDNAFFCCSAVPSDIEVWVSSLSSGFFVVTGDGPSAPDTVLAANHADSLLDGLRSVLDRLRQMGHQPARVAFQFTVIDTSPKRLDARMRTEDLKKQLQPMMAWI